MGRQNGVKGEKDLLIVERSKCQHLDQTRDCWVVSMNASSELCCHPKTMKVYSGRDSAALIKCAGTTNRTQPFDLGITSNWSASRLLTLMAL